MNAVLDAIAVLTDWNVVPPFQCHSVCRIGDEGDPVQEYDAHIDPIQGSYEFIARASGKRSAYDATTGAYVVDDVPVAQRPAQNFRRLDGELHPVRLAFPLSLPIWGRRRDAFRMTSATLDGHSVVVPLVRVTDPAATVCGTLTVDLEKRVATRLLVPDLLLQFGEIGPGRSFRSAG